MNSLILNRESFEMPADGWYQIALALLDKRSILGIYRILSALSAAWLGRITAAAG